MFNDKYALQQKNDELNIQIYEYMRALIDKDCNIHAY